MNNPLVSIIVPCYNQAQYLPETLDSVLAQTYPYWECIIVNDGSPDNTEEIAKHYCEKDSRFKYVYKENGGLSSARNVSLHLTDPGKSYHAKVDNTIYIVHEGFPTKTGHTFEYDKGAGFIFIK